MDTAKIVKIVNRNTSNIGYTLPELHIRRQLQARQPKNVTFGELQELMNTPGGESLIRKYIAICDVEAFKELFPYEEMEPEYYYDIPKVKEILEQGSLDELLDCLDFAPDGVLAMVKELAIELEIPDLRKRKAIEEALDFNLESAIMVKNTKYDGDEEAVEDSTPHQKQRRVKTTTTEAPTQGVKKVRRLAQ